MTKKELKKIKENVIQKIKEKYYFINLSPEMFDIMFNKAIDESKNKFYDSKDEYFLDIFRILDRHIKDYIRNMVKNHDYLKIYIQYMSNNVSDDLLSNLLLIISFIKDYGIFSILDYIKILKYDSKSNGILGKVILNDSIRSKLTSEDKLILDKLLQAYKIINNIIDEDIFKRKYSNESLDFYLSQIGNYSNLSFEEEQDAFKRYHEGDNDARELLINSNLRYVVKIAREFINCGADVMDLIQEGTTGLMKALDKFDFSLGYRFSTYSTNWIKQPIRRFLRSNFNLIVYPQDVANDLLKINSARKNFEDLGILFPSLEDLALKTGLSIEKVKDYLLISKVDSFLEMPIGEYGYLLGESIEDPASRNPEEIFTPLSSLFVCLKDREREIVEYHLGFNGEPKTFVEIGDMYGISYQRAQQLFRRSIFKLKRRI